MRLAASALAWFPHMRIPAVPWPRSFWHTSFIVRRMSLPLRANLPLSIMPKSCAASQLRLPCLLLISACFLQSSPMNVPRKPIDKPSPCYTAVQNRKAYIDRKSTRLNSSHLGISYAVFCLKNILCLEHMPWESYAAFISFARFPDFMSFPDVERWLHTADYQPFPVEIHSLFYHDSPAKGTKHLPPPLPLPI